MNLCDTCIIKTIPECAETLILDSDAISAGSYIVEIENHHGAKQKLDIDSGYSHGLWIDVSELPQGYLFRQNEYELKVYASEADYQCGSPVEFCTGISCVTLKVEQIETEQLDILIECCE